MFGNFLAKRWQLPGFIAEGILHHHDYQSLRQVGGVSDTARALVALSVLSEHIIRLHGTGHGEQEWVKAAEYACAFFGLSLGAVDDLIDDMCDWMG